MTLDLFSQEKPSPRPQPKPEPEPEEKPEPEPEEKPSPRPMPKRKPSLESRILRQFRPLLPDTWPDKEAFLYDLANALTRGLRGDISLQKTMSKVTDISRRYRLGEVITSEEGRAAMEATMKKIWMSR